MGVREVSNRGGNIIGHFPSLKMGRMVAFESLIERDYIYLLDYDPAVTEFGEQPLTIDYVEDGKKLHYTPDFKVELDGTTLLVECKPAKYVDTEDNQRKFAAGVAYCADCGWEFQVVTEEQIRAGFRLQNIKLVTRHARFKVQADFRSRVYSVLKAHQEMSLGQLATAIDAANVPAAMAGLYYLAYRHMLVLPIDTEKVSENSVVRYRDIAGLT
jgi:hypothetical protein